MSGTKPKISIIVALQEKDRGIGENNDLLFRISDDLKRFKSLTTGHPVIMGRKTYESIGRPLPNRPNIVLSRNTDLKIPGVELADTIEDALALAQKSGQGSDEIFIIGGGQIFAQTLALADRLYLTVVQSDLPAKVFFPEYEQDFKKIVFEENHRDEKMGLTYTFKTLDRI